MKKYATFHLLMVNIKKYIDGACISAYTYRKYGNSDIEHVCMVDKHVTEKDKKKLSKYFDRVVNVPLMKVKHDFDIKSNKRIERYGSWMDYACTKWMIFFFEEYKKILFCDIDTLAVENYTKVFDVKTPAWTSFHKTSIKNNKIAKIVSKIKTNDVLSERYIKDYTSHSSKEICNYEIKNRKSFYIPINASLVLVQPSKKTFNDLFNYVKKIKCLSLNNGPDESILFHYFICHKKVKAYLLGFEYLTTLWLFNEKHTSFKNVKKPLILNFDSTDKPWLKKNKKEYWKEELMWYTLKKKLKL